MIRVLLLSTLFSLINYSTYCQSPRVARHTIKATPDNNVSVLWTMNAGSTCPSLVVERSLDQTNYQKIYTYPSVCGSSNREISYSWTDTNPILYNISYYRLNLDDIEFTIPIEIDLQSRLKNSNSIVYPNPSNGTSIIELRNPSNQTFNIDLFDSLGNLIYSAEDLSGKEFQMNLEHPQNGLYTLRITFENGAIETNQLIIAL